MSTPGSTSDSAGRTLRRRRPLALVLLAAAVTGLVVAALAVGAFRARGDDAAGAPTAGPPSPSGSAPGSCSTAGGDLRFDTEMTAADGHSVPYSVSLPADYCTSDQRYPVLFALHGRDQTNATFLLEAERLRAAVDAGALRDVVIVTPDSALDGRWEGRYATDVVDELLPHVEQTYRVLPGAEHRLLVGWSMGGHGAFRLGVEHPATFAAVWSVDGAMSREPTSYLDHLHGVRADPPQVRLVGGNLNGDRVEQVVDLFTAQGVTFPYQRLPLDHDFHRFVDADRDAGWPTLRWMDAQLGQPT